MSKNLVSKLDGHFARCAAIAAAGIGGTMIVAPQAAEAAVVSSGPVNINIPSTTSGTYLNIVTGASNPNPAPVPGWDLNPWSSSALNMFSNTGANPTRHVGTGSTYFNLAVGTLIGPASTFGGSGTNTIAGSTPLNLNSSNNCVGFSFLDESGGQPATKYGWMQIALGATAQAQPRAIVAYAYESTAGVGIQACVPEPTSLALLALGAVGLIRRR